MLCMKHRIHSILLFLLFPLFIWGNLNFHQLDIKTGISDNFIQDIVKDQYGFMWFATQNGVNRYDGYRFKHYMTIELGAYNNDVEWIAEDGSGLLWLKTPVNYCYYNREKDEFVNSIEIPLSRLGINSPIINLFIDVNKNLWCSTNDRLYHYQFDKEILSSFIIPDQTKIVHLASRNLQTFVLLSDNTIATLDTINNTFKNETVTSCADELRPRLYLDTTSTLWVYTSKGNFLKSYNTTKREWFNFQGTERFYGKDNIVMTLIDEGDGNIWIGTDNQGIFILNNLNKEFKQHTRIKNEPFTLISNHINCFFKDDNDVMWIGTSKQGVAYTNPDKNAFKNHKTLLDEDINCLIEDKLGNLWIGYDGMGIEKYTATGECINYNNLQNHIPSNLIVCSFTDSKDRLWWGSYGNGAFYIQDKSYVPLKELITNDNDYDIPLFVRRITEDNNGNLWLATFTQGLYCLDVNGKLYNYTG